MSSDWAHGEQDHEGGLDRYVPGKVHGSRSALERHHIRRGHGQKKAAQHAVPKRSRQGVVAALRDYAATSQQQAPTGADTAPNAQPTGGTDADLWTDGDEVTLPTVSRQTCFLYVLAASGILLIFVLVIVALFRNPQMKSTPIVVPEMQPYFDAVWERTDLAVQRGEAQRGWTWGPAPIHTAAEPFTEAPDGTRLVQYYDKGRLEITDPAQPQQITMGLLVREMVAGQVALGEAPDNVHVIKSAQIAVAGDPLTDNPDAPTYASFQDLASLDNDRPALELTGAQVMLALDKAGNVSDAPPEVNTRDENVKIVAFEPTLKHNIPHAFWRTLQGSGPIYDNGELQPERLLYDPWQLVTGLPITEPFWINTLIAGNPQWIMVQLYERRVLTYTPSNPPEFQVEMGNTGLHYLAWRYGITGEAE